MHPEIERLRGDLRARRHRPSAYPRFLLGSWRVSRATARAHPDLTRMWRHRALWRAAALPWLAAALGCAPASAPLWLTYALQQLDLYLHLGLNRAPGGDAPWPAFPLALECTLVRAYAAAALLDTRARPRRAFTLGLATDLLDGHLARRQGGETQLGALLDAEYDAYLLLAAARVARRRGTLQRAAERMIWLRFGGSLLAGAIAFFVLQHPAPPRSTPIGKMAGAIQAALIVSALSDQRAAPRWQPVLLALTTSGAVAGQVRRYRTALTPSREEGYTALRRHRRPGSSACAASHHATGL